MVAAILLCAKRGKCGLANYPSHPVFRPLSCLCVRLAPRMDAPEWISGDESAWNLELPGRFDGIPRQDVCLLKVLVSIQPFITLFNDPYQVLNTSFKKYISTSLMEICLC